MKTLAAVLEKINAPLKIRELEVPPLKEGQVLVKIAYSGLCRSQLNEIQGNKGDDKFLPHTLGHEGSGIVLETGPGVAKVQKDDHVVLSWIAGTGLNAPSSKYMLKDLIVNSGAISTFMSHAIISENRLIPIPKEIPLKEAALLGCALPTGMGIILNTIQIKPGDVLAVFGVGGIGMSAILGAQLMHASKIIAVDICDYKLNLAKELGATHTINAKKEQVASKIKDLTNGSGVDYSIEAAGQKETMQTAFEVVRNKGGCCVITGNLRYDDRIEINPFDLICGKKIIGTWGGESQIDRDIELYTNLLTKSVLNVSPLITHEYDLMHINEAIEQLTSGQNTVRCMIKNSE